MLDISSDLIPVVRGLVRQLSIGWRPRTGSHLGFPSTYTSRTLWAEIQSHPCKPTRLCSCLPLKIYTLSIATSLFICICELWLGYHKHMHIYTHMHLYVHVHMYVYMRVCIDVSESLAMAFSFHFCWYTQWMKMELWLVIFYQNQFQEMGLSKNKVVSYYLALW